MHYVPPPHHKPEIIDGNIKCELIHDGAIGGLLWASSALKNKHKIRIITVLQPPDAPVLVAYMKRLAKTARKHGIEIDDGRVADYVYGRYFESVKEIPRLMDRIGFDDWDYQWEWEINPLLQDGVPVENKRLVEQLIELNYAAYDHRVRLEVGAEFGLKAIDEYRAMHPKAKGIRPVAKIPFDSVIFRMDGQGFGRCSQSVLEERETDRPAFNAAVHRAGEYIQTCLAMEMCKRPTSPYTQALLGRGYVPRPVFGS